MTTQDLELNGDRLENAITGLEVAINALRRLTGEASCSCRVNKLEVMRQELEIERIRTLGMMNGKAEHA